ncbi:MAG: hypothetical protein K0Q73_9157 [Paenibacillus sp.]|nr:hypothetical protein [Paenibacillus sp.]
MKHPSHAILERFLKSQGDFTDFRHYLNFLFPIQIGIELKNPPMEIGGKQRVWFKESLVPQASANAERLYKLKKNHM